MKAKLIATIAAVTILCGQSLAAQSGPRGYVVFGGGVSTSANDFTSHVPLRANAEDGSYDVDYSVPSGPAITAGAAIRVWKQLGLRAGVSRAAALTPATVSASVPHPFFFGRLRTTSGSVDGLTREELAYNLNVAGMFPVTPRMFISVFGGPYWFQATQASVQSFTYAEAYPYDSIAFGQVDTSGSSVSRIAFGGGADISFFLTKTIGVAGTVQYARTTADLPTRAVDTPIKVGGAKASVGIVIKIP